MKEEEAKQNLTVRKHPATDNYHESQHEGKEEEQHEEEDESEQNPTVHIHPAADSFQKHQHLTVQKRPAAVGYQKDKDDEEGRLEGLIMLTML